MVISFLLAGLPFPGCQQKSDTATKIEPIAIEDSRDSLYRVRLTASKAAEYKIDTATVGEEMMSGQTRRVIPVAAVVRDQFDNTWTVTNPDDLVFMRSRVQISHIEGELAVLSDGPQAGTAVVTVGADKLLSSEFRDGGLSVERKAMSDGRQSSKSSGMATLQEDGTLRVVYRTQGATGLTADIVVQYKSTDAEYRQIIDQVSGLKVGETKFVSAAPDE